MLALANAESPHKHVSLQIILFGHHLTLEPNSIFCSFYGLTSTQEVSNVKYFVRSHKHDFSQTETKGYQSSGNAVLIYTPWASTPGPSPPT